MTATVKIPAGFYRDHEDRDLPTPVAIRETRTHVVIACDDPALPELLDDARHYAGDGTDAHWTIVRSAKALVAAIERECV